MKPLSRRDLLRYSGALGAATIAAAGDFVLSDSANGATIRTPDSLPYPRRPAGTVDATLPFDHIVVVMMENHSFDNYLGLLPIAGSKRADGFSFANRVPTNSNPSATGTVAVFPFSTTAQGPDVGQDWNATHRQID